MLCGEFYHRRVSYVEDVINTIIPDNGYVFLYITYINGPNIYVKKVTIDRPEYPL